MRTTVRLDDELYRQAKVVAARSGRTVAEVIEDALRASLSRADAGPRTAIPPLPTFGVRGPLPGVDVTSNAGMLEAMDAEVPVDARR